MRVADMRTPFGAYSQRGVTLIEMIVAIAVSGVLIAMAGMFVRNQITSYFDVARRAELSDIADGALRRIARDVQNALPNSLRPAGAASSLIEFVPIVNAGRFASQETFDLTSPLSVQGPSISVVAGQSVVICNTGQPLADVYAGNNRRVLSVGANLSSLAFSGSAITDYCSSNRFQVIGSTVAYAFEPSPVSTLWRFSGCLLQSAQPSTIAALSAACSVKAALATKVESVSFNYVATVLPSLGILTISLVLSDASAPGERVTLLHQVNVQNSP